MCILGILDPRGLVTTKFWSWGFESLSLNDSDVITYLVLLVVVGSVVQVTQDQ